LRSNRLVAGKGGFNDGCGLYHHYWNLLRSDLGIAQALRKIIGRRVMNWLYLIAGVIALGLLSYLFIALLFPERLG